VIFGERKSLVESESDLKHDSHYRGKVFLIGAGPGDPGLLTLKAARTLSECDVIVYDHLVNPEILTHCRRGAELIYAGKRGGERSIPQQDICLLLIQKARSGQIVGRLKGGDPFIFGRGGEEALALAAAGIEWEVIPGISSGVAAAAYAGIPLTHRHSSSSVAFITGHEGIDKNGSHVDWRASAHAADTLVIFMCGSTIAGIARELISAGRPDSTPVALVRWGTYEFQEVYTGSLADIASFNESINGTSVAAKFDAPVIAIVGEPVKLADTLQWFKHGTRRDLAQPKSNHEAEIEALKEDRYVFANRD
jgi:uroporphyrinogen III methyltransferase/synthase